MAEIISAISKRPGEILAENVYFMGDRKKAGENQRDIVDEYGYPVPDPEQDQAQFMDPPPPQQQYHQQQYSRQRSGGSYGNGRRYNNG